MARAKDKVVIGYVHPTEVSAFFTESLVRLIAYDLLNTHRLAGTPITKYSSANVSNARNAVVRTFLQQSTADWLLMLDADMTFDHSLVEDLLHNASRDRAPVVGGLCFGQEDGRLFATLYGVAKNDEHGVHMVRYDDFPADGMFQVAATGAACVLMHRTVLERVEQAEAAKGNTAYPWYQEGTIDGKVCGEDVTFCLRVGALGLPVFVDTGVRLGHAKTYLATYDMYRGQRVKAIAEESE